jgi:Asp-tRNA(Asn)/Glu-tRNA(Gln) amidotransferase A subunit family amidase
VGEVDRRAFLERMASLSTTAMISPTLLGSRISDTRPTGTQTSNGYTGADIKLPQIQVRQVTDLTELTIVEAATLIQRGEISPIELTQAYLRQIDRWEGVYQAFNTILYESALESARIVNPRRDHPLAGIPLAIKDNFFTAGVRTTANSFIFEDFTPNFDATAWARLRDAGAILLGKTQMGPLATTAATTPTGTRTTVNAWAPFAENVSPGGSSSGSATAVASRMAPCGTGTQTGGSITNPSNAQALTGIKPTMGRVSLHGILPLTYTRDHVGPLARDAQDAALMLQIMAGPDPADLRTLGLPSVPDYLAAVDISRQKRPLRKPFRIGVLPDYLDEPEHETGYFAAREEQEEQRDLARERTQRTHERNVATTAARGEMLRTLEELGAEIVEVQAPRDWTTLTSSSFNNVRLPERSEIFLEYLRDDVRQFGVSLSPWINGLLFPATEYVRGQRARFILLKSILEEIFTQCDAVVQTAPYPFDMVGLPLVAFPIGFEEESVGVPRPIGAMLGGTPYSEDSLLTLAAAYQRATDWHLRRPANPDQLHPVTPSDPIEPRSPGRIDLFDVMEFGQ